MNPTRGGASVWFGRQRRKFAITAAVATGLFALSAGVAIAQRTPRVLKETDPPVVVPRGPLPPKPDPSAARPIDSVEPPWPTGIIEENESPFYREAEITNRWVEALGKDRYRVVYAGSLKSDSSQGVLIVTEAGPTHAAKVGKGLNLVPGKTGAVRISEAAAEQLILTSVEAPKTAVAAANNWTAVFDLRRGAFE